MEARPDRELVHRVRTVLESHPEVLDGYLFGSHARGEAREHSDVDVAVFVDPPRLDDGGFGYDAELGTELMRALGSNAVDVVLLNRATPLLYHRVLHDGMRVIARDLVATTAREGRALSRYCDFVPQLTKIERAAAARIRAGAFGR